MKRNIFYITLFFCLNILMTTIISAQEVTNAEISWSVKQKTKDRPRIISHDENGFFVLRKVQHGLIRYDIFIDYYSNDMTLIRSLEVGKDYRLNIKEYDSVIELKDKFYVFTIIQNKETKKSNFFIQSIDKKGLKKTSDLEKFAELEIGENFCEQGHLSTRISEDQSKFLTISHKLCDQTYELNVYNDNFNLVWDNKVDFNNIYQNPRVQSMLLDNKGCVHFFISEHEGSSHNKKVSEETSCHYKIVSYFDDKEVIEYEIDLNDKWINNLRMRTDYDGNIICAGFYSNKKNISNIIGSFYIKISTETNKVKIVNMHEFEKDFIQGIVNKGEKNTENDAKMQNYHLNDIVIREDGSSLLIGEQHYSKRITRTSTSSSGTSTTKTTNYYYNNDIIVISIFSDGKIEWVERIVKRQMTKDDFGRSSSFASCLVKDKIYFIFNEHKKNQCQNPKQKQYSYNGHKKHSVTTIISMDSNGKQKKEILFSCAEQGLVPIPSVNAKISNNGLIILAQWKKNQGFAKITFND